jgi:MFS family permease
MMPSRLDSLHGVGADRRDMAGTMGMMGNLGGFVSPVIGYIVQQTNNWTLTFYVTATMYAIGSVFWLMMDPVTPSRSKLRIVSPGRVRDRAERVCSPPRAHQPGRARLSRPWNLRRHSDIGSTESRPTRYRRGR